MNRRTRRTQGIKRSNSRRLSGLALDKEILHVLQTVSKSMTAEEKRNPLLLQESKKRLTRVARGSGIDPKHLKFVLSKVGYSKRYKKKAFRATEKSTGGTAILHPISTHIAQMKKRVEYLERKDSSR